MRLGSGPMTALLAAYRAGQPPGSPRAAAMADRVSPGATVYRAGGVAPGTASTVPAAMMSGSGPMTVLLGAYRAGQPPGSPRAAAMPDRVSPGRTVHRAGPDGWRAAGAASRAADTLARVTWVVTGAAPPARSAPGLPALALLVAALVPGLLAAGLLAAALVLALLVLALLVVALLLTAVPLARAGLGPRRPVTATRARASQASAHADMIHLRTIVLSFLGPAPGGSSQPGAEGQ